MKSAAAIWPRAGGARLDDVLQLHSVIAYFRWRCSPFPWFRLYKTVLGMVQKTNDGHPFTGSLSVDTTVLRWKGHKMADRAVSELNCCTTCLKDLFLVKDIFESVKFGFVLYLFFPYLGAWFNTMTRHMGYVALFTLPKVSNRTRRRLMKVLARSKEGWRDLRQR